MAALTGIVGKNIDDVTHHNSAACFTRGNTLRYSPPDDK